MAQPAHELAQRLIQISERSVGLVAKYPAIPAPTPGGETGAATSPPPPPAPIGQGR